MNKKQIVLYSPIALEKWNYNTPNTVGIGGSETCHVELAFEFSKAGYDVISLAPCDRKELGPGGALWVPIEDVDTVLNSKQEKIWLVFRDPIFFDKPNLNKDKNIFYFIAQDVDYDWNDERLSKVDKYITLCKTHHDFTLSKYPQLKDKLYISSNGINTRILKEKYNKYKDNKISKRVIYSSSPDRGLELLLENWFRVEERHPDVKLDVYYGFDNLLKLANNDWRTELYYNILSLAGEYKTVTLHGRLPQNQLYNEMATSSIWAYPSQFPETSCITCMEMQALGVYPVITKYWAQGENTFHGTILDGNPKDYILDKCIFFKELNNILSIDTCEDMKKIREELHQDAVDSFGWEKIARQYIKWFENE